MRVVALVSDLMDRSRISASVPSVTFARDVAGTTDAEIIVIDLTVHGSAVAEVRRMAPGAVIVAFGSHVDEERLLAAKAAGADRVLPRSRFFRDPAAALAPGDGP